MNINFLDELGDELGRLVSDEQRVIESAINDASASEGVDIFNTSIYDLLNGQREEASGEFEELSKFYALKAQKAEELADKIKYNSLSTLYNSYPQTLGCALGWMLRSICGPLQDIKQAAEDLAGLLKGLDVSLVALDIPLQNGISGLIKLGSPLIHAIVNVIASLQTRLLLDARGQVGSLVNDLIQHESCSEDLLERCLPLENLGHFLMDSLDDLMDDFKFKLRDMWGKSDQKYQFKLDQINKLALKSEWMDIAKITQGLRQQLLEVSSIPDSQVISTLVDEALKAVNADMIFDTTFNRYIPAIYTIDSCGCYVSPGSNRRKDEIIPPFRQGDPIVLSRIEDVERFTDC